MRRQKGLSRRDFLKTVGLGGAGFAIFANGLPLGVIQAQAGEIVIKTTGWPYDVLPDSEPSDGYSSYQLALKTWLESHPNVRFERIDTNIWDGQALLTALAGGTAPTFFTNGSIAGWTTAGYQSIYSQGLVANDTEAFNKYGIDAQLSDTTKAGKSRYMKGDQVFGLPIEIVPGNGIFYRKDLFAEAGLSEPTPNWTWDDLREYAKALTTDTRKGIAMQTIGVYWALASEGLGLNQLLSTIPSPESNWKWRVDFSSYLSDFEKVIQRHRAMVFEDKSVSSDISMGDDVVMQQFFDGNVAMMTGPSLYFTRTAPPYPPALADQLGKPLGEIVGFAPHPRGGNGHFSRESQITVHPFGIDPNASPELVDTVVDLYNFMELGDGFVMRRQTDYERTHDLRQAFAAWPYPRREQSIEGVTGTPVEAWGQDYVDTVNYIASVGGYPETGEYFPGEQNLGPTADAWNDALSTFNFESGDIDIAATLKQAEDNWNQQAEGLSSSISRDDFLVGATHYYDAVSQYWAAKFPDFNDKVWKQFYESTIRPALGV